MTSPSALPDPARSALETSIGHASVWHLTIVTLVGLAAEFAVLAQKDVLIFEWRPTDLAAIALNYYRHGFHFLHPQIFWGGNGSGDVEMEFPLIPYSIAVLYALFGVHDALALAIPMLSAIGLALVVNVFAKHFFGPAVGFIAGLFAATSPALVAMSTGVWPDVPPIFCGTAGLYLLVRWVEDGGTGRFVAAASGIALAILLKLTSLYLGVPVLFLFWVKYRRDCWRTLRVWAFAALVLLPAVCWYVHAYQLFRESHNTFGIIASGYSKFGSVDLLTDPVFYARTFARLVLFHTTPLGFLCVAMGSVGRVERPIHYLFHVWLGAVLFYLLVAAEGVNLGHYQYALPILPPTAVLAGLGLVAFARRLESLGVTRTPWSARVATVIFVACLAANTVAANYVYQRRGTASSKLSAQKMRTGLALGQLTKPGDLVVVVDARMDDVTPEHSMTPPEVFYFSDRSGWYRSAAWLTADTIEDLRHQGARYLAVSANSADWFRAHYSALYQAYSGRYRTLTDSDDGIIYDLR